MKKYIPYIIDIECSKANHRVLEIGIIRAPGFQGPTTRKYLVKETIDDILETGANPEYLYWAKKALKSLTSGEQARVLPFAEIFTDIRKYIERTKRNDSVPVIISHALDKDFEHLKTMERLLGLSSVVPEHVAEFLGPYPKVCSQRLLTQRCPRFMALGNPQHCCLQSCLARIGRQTQSHEAIQDCLDLLEVLQVADSLDGFAQNLLAMAYTFEKVDPRTPCIPQSTV